MTAIISKLQDLINSFSTISSAASQCKKNSDVINKEVAYQDHVISKIRTTAKNSHSLSLDFSDTAKSMNQQSQAIIAESQTAEQLLAEFRSFSSEVIAHVSKFRESLPKMIANEAKNLIALSQGAPSSMGFLGDRFNPDFDSELQQLQQTVAKGAEISDLVASTLAAYLAFGEKSSMLSERVSASADRLLEANSETSNGIENLSRTFYELLDSSSNSRDVAVDLQNHVEKMDYVVDSIIGEITGSSIQHLSGEEFAKLDSDRFRIIDVRSREEYFGELGHIQGSQLIPLNNQFATTIGVEDKEHQYLFVCRSGGRSARAARIAQSAGIKQVFNLSGGMLRWGELGYPIARTKQAC